MSTTSSPARRDWTAPNGTSILAAASLIVVAGGRPDVQQANFLTLLTRRD